MDIKSMLWRGFRRFYSEGYSVWSQEKLEKALRPREQSFALESPDVQRVLAELEAEGVIRLLREKNRYLEVLEPKS